jgi:4-amino-4-deoxy-L-arabinose transferase-like glycosyltransferase
MKPQTIKKIELILAVFILLFSLGLRINAPAADLPSHITFSGSILTDEGNQCHNSRSKTLYGEWFPDDWRITNYNPILPWIKYAVFQLFGVGLVQLRSVSYLFAALSLLFFFLILKSYMHAHSKFALLGILLLGTNFFYVMYNKIGTFETSIIFWVILIIYFFEKYRTRQKRIFLLLAGSAACMAFIFKSIMAYILPVPFATLILIYLFVPTPEGKKISLKQGIKDILFIIAGVLILFIPWYLLHYLPNREWMVNGPGRFMGHIIFPHSLSDIVRNFINFPWKNQFLKIPVVWLGAILYIPVFIRRLLRKQANITEIGFVMIFFAHTFTFFIMTYRPTRYFIPVIPAMAFMTLLLFAHWYQKTRVEQEITHYRSATKYFLFITDTLWLSLAAYFCLIPLLSRYFLKVRLPHLSIYYPIVSAALVAGAYLMKNLYKKSPAASPFKKIKPAYLLIPLIGLMTVISLFVDMRYYLDWYTHRTYNVWNMSKELGEKLDNAYIAGMTASVGVMENRHKVLWLYPNFVNWNKDNFERYPLTHALVGTDVSQEIFNFFNEWPERMAHARLLKIYHIKNYFLHLFSFENPYITDCRKEENGQYRQYRLTAINPTSRPLSNVRVGKVFIIEKKKKEGQEKTARQIDLQAVNGHSAFTLNPGKNVLILPQDEIPGPDVSSILFFLDYPHPFTGEKLRYEGEIFHHRTGINKKVPAASNGYVRYFNRRIRGVNFLCYRADIPYAKGIITAKFKLEFSDLITKFKPICYLEIYSHNDDAPIAEKVIKPRDVKKNKTGEYSLSFAIPLTRTLEFRIKSTRYASISFDYVDLTYYQGFFLDRQ